MGNLLRLLAIGDDSCCGMPENLDVFVDFENAQPSPEEAELYNQAEGCLTEANKILNELMNYKGASKEIREAISNQTAESELQAWNTVLPLVLKLKTFFEFSKKLEEMVPKILSKLCDRDLANSLPRSGGFNEASEQLDSHQATVKEFAKLLDFVLKFDEAKMMNPALQNDFSYYRRTTQRLRNSQNQNSNEETSSELESIPMNTCNSMSLFFANATPMLQALVASTAKFVEDNTGPVANVTTALLAVMAKVCQKMLDNQELRQRIKQKETERFILRVMVALIILYDHIQPTGAFAKGSHVDVKGCMKVLRDQKDGTDGLLNALRYTTKHLNDETTPKAVKQLICEDIPA